MSWLAPDAPWPDHPGKDARKALSQARALGWSLRAEGHFGRIRCPHQHHNGGCELPIWGTSRDASGSVTARKIQQKLRACERLGGDDPEAVPAVVCVVLTKVEKVVEAAEHLDESDRRRQSAQELLTGPDAELNEDEALERAIAAERSADDAEALAWTAAIDAGADDPWPPGERARGLAALASGRLAELGQRFDLESLDEAIQHQMDDLRSRIKNLDP